MEFLFPAKHRNSLRNAPRCSLLKSPPEALFTKSLWFLAVQKVLSSSKRKKSGHPTAKKPGGKNVCSSPSEKAGPLSPNGEKNRGGGVCSSPGKRKNREGGKKSLFHPPAAHLKKLSFWQGLKSLWLVPAPDGPFSRSKRRLESDEEKALGPGTAYVLNLPRDAQVVPIMWLAESHPTSARFGVDCGHWFYWHLECIEQPSKLFLQPDKQINGIIINWLSLGKEVWTKIPNENYICYNFHSWHGLFGINVVCEQVSLFGFWANDSRDSEL